MMKANTMRFWHLGQRGRSMGIREGSGRIWAWGTGCIPCQAGAQHSQSPMAADGAVMGHGGAKRQRFAGQYSSHPKT
jgi:hypothetical protein